MAHRTNHKAYCGCYWSILHNSVWQKTTRIDHKTNKRLTIEGQQIHRGRSMAGLLTKRQRNISSVERYLRQVTGHHDMQINYSTGTIDLASKAMAENARVENVTYRLLLFLTI